MISRRLDKIIKRALQRNTVRRDPVRSRDSLNWITSRRVGTGYRGRRDGGVRKNVWICEPVSATSCQQRGKGGVDLLVCDGLPVSSEIEATEDRRWRHVRFPLKVGSKTISNL